VTTAWTGFVRLVRFAWRVVTAFLDNRGILLAGGVGYNALLSVVPFLVLTFAALSFFFDHERVLEIVRAELKVVVPGNVDAILQAAQAYLEHQTSIGVVSMVALIFFSSIGFRMLEQAIAALFHTSAQGEKRHMLVSAALPYSFLLLMMALLFALTLFTTLLDTFGERSPQLFRVQMAVETHGSVLLRLVGFVAMVLLFAGIYRVLPVVKIAAKRALVGGLCAATLWLLIGRFLVYYFSTLSMVNVIYGSLATVVVLLLFMEIAIIILLLGAQVIAELEASAKAGVPWYERPVPVAPRPSAPPVTSA
jgi:YihY family inner membrane protein